MADIEEWVVWNGSLGILDKVTIGHVEAGEGGRSAFLAPPYGVVGPFNLDELEAEGRIAFGACLVMSRRKWTEDQVKLRLEAREKRRAFLLRMDFSDDDQAHREVLNLPMEGALEPSEIRAAFRRLAKTAHPDAGGSDEDYRRITEARDALLDQFASAS
ncbi:molecular chaperone DnaJ [Methylocapsa acidiphila]|uniref:molecular chaperone DnaJ n=1 Tax=Methylocapsa acidiphila TaxID=133552 RepID=UPI000415BE6E|nr:molecular chaperone DnaJ [Methylocapsa acidiphila]